MNLIDEALTRPMVVCSIDFPPGIDEAAKAGLTLVDGTTVRPGGIAQAPVAFECRLERAIEDPGRHIIFGEVTWMHVRDTCIDPQTLRVHPEHYCPIARLHGDRYISASTPYFLERMSYDEWRTRDAESTGPAG